MICCQQPCPAQLSSHSRLLPCSCKVGMTKIRPIADDMANGQNCSRIVEFGICPVHGNPKMIGLSLFVFTGRTPYHQMRIFQIAVTKQQLYGFPRQWAGLGNDCRSPVELRLPCHLASRSHTRATLIYSLKATAGAIGPGRPSFLGDSLSYRRPIASQQVRLLR